MKWQSIPTFLILLLAGGCAAAPEGRSEAPGSGSLEDRSGAEIQAPPTNDEVMYRVLAAEVEGNDGDLEKSAADYLAAALESSDPAIAERATRIAIAARSWQFAAMAADRWVVLQPDSLDARQTAVQAMLLNGDYMAAEHQMSGILDLMGDDRGHAWTLIAAQLARSPNPEKARGMLQRLINQYGAADQADALFAQSQLAVRMGELDQAAALAQQAVAREPDRAELHAWVGRLAVNQQDMERAMESYRQARALKPQDRTIAMAYAELLKRDGQKTAALDVLAELPDTPETRFARVGFALAADAPDAAASIYRGFHNTDYPDSFERAFQAARAAEMLGLPSEAIGWYEQVRKGENALAAVLRRSVLLAETGELEAARNLLASTRLHRDQGILGESFLTESQILVNAGQPEEAWNLLTEALELMPGDTNILYSRALVAVQLERIETAEADLRLILKDEPGNAAVLNALGYTLADMTDRLEEAEELIRTAHELQPNEASIIDSMGWVAFRRGRFEEALEYLEEAWQRDNNPEIAAHLGEVLWVLGREAEAREAWQLGLDQDAENEILQETLDRLGVDF